MTVRPRHVHCRLVQMCSPTSENGISAPGTDSRTILENGIGMLTSEAPQKSLRISNLIPVLKPCSVDCVLSQSSHHECSPGFGCKRAGGTPASIAYLHCPIFSIE